MITERVAQLDGGTVPKDTGVLAHLGGLTPVVPASASELKITVAPDRECMVYITATVGPVKKRWPLNKNELWGSGQPPIMAAFTGSTSITYDVEFDREVKVDFIAICEVT